MPHRRTAATIALALSIGCAHASVEQLIFERKNEEALELVRTSSAPPADDPYYVKALYAASFHGDDAIVLALLERGADVIGENPYGTTPLMGALHDNTTSIHRTTALLLLEHGANVNQRSAKAGMTPLHFACRRQAKTPSEQADKLAMVKLLIERGADPFARTERGETTLYFATYDGGLEVPRELLARGVDPNVTDDDGGNALLEAAVRGHDDAARLLLDHGARPRVTLEAPDPKEGPGVIYNEFLASGRGYLIFSQWSEARGDEAEAREALPVARDQLSLAATEYRRAQKFYTDAVQKARTKRTNRQAAATLGSMAGIAAAALGGVGMVVIPGHENTVERLEATLAIVEKNLALSETSLAEVERGLAQRDAP